MINSPTLQKTIGEIIYRLGAVTSDQLYWELRRLGYSKEAVGQAHKTVYHLKKRCRVDVIDGVMTISVSGIRQLDLKKVSTSINTNPEPMIPVLPDPPTKPNYVLASDFSSPSHDNLISIKTSTIRSLINNTEKSGDFIRGYLAALLDLGTK